VPKGLKKVKPGVSLKEIGGLPIRARACHLFLNPAYLKKQIKVVCVM
jgi:hypothetical protein